MSGSTSLTVQPNHTVQSKDQNTGTHITEDSEARRYTITQQLAAMTVENSGKEVGSNKEGMERLAVSSGAVVLLTSGTSSTQYSVQVVPFGISYYNLLPVPDVGILWIRKA